MMNPLEIIAKISEQTETPANGGTLDAGVFFIIDGIIALIGIAAVVVIILGAVTYMTSQGDPGKVKKGKDTIIYGVIGLVVALLAFAIVTFTLKSVGS